ncbi:TPA: helix-turn-helix domain-containing protein [Burkholderia cenocepacia]|uniref:Transcriptional regulator n=1 Tax=Burkholderia cenocepacia TaxID=95486 RepID=A0A1V2W369_9BURK|nr:helix-turn-helix transcriptional regulator [Burkholderia cenocepacia]MBR8248661.1 helix-turn-helix transcriptional regulator [Burkholderia cenocepacia]MBR8288835.1 helix-turn-helix transcriptional regulator [Burkholderia cenocepacia]MBR8497104.1 helix-turn-helix transcriptional regulator [Burkholderia cenocepacia]MDN7456563.1 helix-turn-helix transcriptional regulator [Burkholderia cenocepacia]ONJ13672.1 transcriptional regulator [Burkholderia cenocepacia]
MNAFAAIRQSLGLSQSALAKGLELGQSAISQFERGECEPTPAVARRLIQFAKQHGQTVTFEMIYGDAQPEPSDTVT